MKHKIYLLILLLLALMLSGCNVMQNKSESFDVRGKTAWTMDNVIISAPTGYFMNWYEWVKVDDHTMQLVFTLTDNKDYGEI